MTSNTENSKKYLQCPLTNAMNVIGGKWKIVILGHLLKKEKRFGELNRAIQGVTQKMLTQQLRELEKDGIVHREIYKEIPPKVEYSLTDFGRSLEPIVNQLWAFGEEIIENKTKA
ncbi:helix-turn-helix transcriptional regulator [Flavobacteriales bacterium]|nr:helix-turn-helix transcriptional regulator [Flavobacteriales bacterium]|tara:strand:+ start:138 stop:482 length:345 start_codon:yes stop_codon:yes gene_type:complete